MDLLAAPEALASAARDLAVIRWSVTDAGAAAALQTTGVVAAASDEVSATIAALFGKYGRQYQVVAALAQANTSVRSSRRTQ